MQLFYSSPVLITSVGKKQKSAHNLLAAADVNLLDLIHGAAEDWLNAVKAGKVE